MTTLNQILEALQRHEQRATYGAVGAVLGVPARFVMNNRPRNWLHSWVVRKRDSQPTGYLDVEKHPSLTQRSAVLDTGDALREWLAAPR